MKKALLFILVMMLTFTSFACTSTPQQPVDTTKPDATVTDNNAESTTVPEATESASSTPIKITMIGGMPGGPAWGPAQIGFDKACEELGWEGTYLAPQTAANQTQIAELIITSVTQGADVVFALMYDKDIMGSVVKECKEKGVTLISANASVDGIDAWIGSNPADNGKMFAEAVNQSVPEGEHIYSVSMVTALSTSASDLENAYREALIAARGEANCTFFDMLECQSNTQTAYSNFSAFKLAHPECNVFIAQNSYAGLGIAQYIQEYGLQDSICAIGIDDSQDILQDVKDGLLRATVSQNFYNIGYSGVYLAQKVLNGEPFEFANKAGAQLVTPDIVEEWAAKLGYTLN